MGAVVETEPLQITALDFDVPLSSNSQAVIYWPQPEDGGSELLGYTLIYLDNSIDILASQTTWTITDLTGGENYNIEIQAYNKYGSSISSEPLVYLAS